jgi:hypothetical protein
MESDAIPLAGPAPMPAARARNLGVLAAFYGLAVVWGLRSVRPDEPSGLDLLVPLGLGLALGWWAVADARSRGKPIPMLARPWFFFAFGLLVPGYVIWTRRWRGAGLVLLNVAGYFALCTIVLNVVRAVVPGAGGAE